MSNSTNALNNIHSKLNKIFQNPNINFFIIMNLILMISCYTFINTSLKYTISSFLANPIIILLSLILIILIGYYNINIAILILLLLFIALYSSTLFNKTNTKNVNSIEGFTDATEQDLENSTNKYSKNNKNNDDNDNDNDDDDDNNYDNDNDDDNKDIYGNDGDEEINSKAKEKLKKEFIKKTKEDNVNSRTDKINSIKGVILGSFNKFKTGAENKHKQDILENKKMIYENEKKNNKMNNSKKNNNNNKSNSKNNTKEEFQTIDIRAFDPSNEEDTNFIITKEILQDMLNRIKYNFESNKYLKKYLKHRIEEIVEINKLIDEDED